MKEFPDERDFYPVLVAEAGHHRSPDPADMD